MSDASEEAVMGQERTLADDMNADELRQIARKLTTYAEIYTGDKEARHMAERCLFIAGVLDAAPPSAELLARQEELVKALEETEREYYERAASIHCTTGMIPGRFNITHKLRVAALARAAQPLPHGGGE